MKLSDLLRQNSARVDLVIKYLYFCALNNGINQDFYENMYIKHIQQRTGGKEPEDIYGKRGSDKQTVDVYVNAAKKLFASIKNNGFDAEAVIPVSSEGFILNGAHRIACSRCLGIEQLPVIEIKNSSLPPAWGFEYIFKDALFSKDELLAIARGYLDFYHEVSNIAMVFSPVENEIDKIQEVLGTYGVSVQLSLAVDFSDDDARVFEDFLYDVYSYDILDLADGMKHISNKSKLLSPYPKRVIILLLNTCVERDLYKLSTVIKKDIRDSLHDIVSAKKFITLHVADSHGEKIHIANMVLNEVSLSYLKRRVFNFDKHHLLSWLTSFSQVLNAYAFTKDDCVIVGSSALDVFGIRKSTDLDFTLSDHYRREYFDDGVTHVNDVIDVVTKWYSRRFTTDGQKFTDDMLIYDSRNHFFYRGFKFVIPEVVYERKKIQGRPKDIRDVQLMDEMHFFGEKNTTDGMIL